MRDGEPWREVKSFLHNSSDSYPQFLWITRASVLRKALVHEGVKSCAAGLRDVEKYCLAEQFSACAFAAAWYELSQFRA